MLKFLSWLGEFLVQATKVVAEAEGLCQGIEKLWMIFRDESPVRATT